MKGCFVTFEGIEGCGKTTQLSRLADRLREAGRPVVATRQPGGSEIGRRLRELLLDPATSLAPETELLLYAADRAEHHARVVIPALERDAIVLCDRHLDATLAYQGAARGLSRAWIREMHGRGVLALRPQRTLWFDLPVETALARARERTARTDPAEGRFEDESLSFHRKVREGYASLADAEPDRIRRIDGSGTIEEVAERVEGALSDLPRLAVGSYS